MSAYEIIDSESENSDDDVIIELEKFDRAENNVLSARGADPISADDAAKIFNECGELSTGPQVEDFPYRKGFLKKKSPSWLRGWPSKCFVLENKKLMYFKDQRCRRPQGVLDFDLAKFEIQPQWDYDENEVFGQTSSKPRSCCGWGSDVPGDEEVVFNVAPIGSSRVFELCCARRDANRWVAELRETVRLAKSPENNFLSKQEMWWKFDRITPSAVEEFAQSGDVLLFRTTSNVAQIQRVVTRGIYDHVAIFLRFGKDKLFFLEATGDAGVTMVAWKEFMLQRWYQLYDALAIRRVQFDRSASTLKKLQLFAKSVLGKPYSISPSRMLQNAEDNNVIVAPETSDGKKRDVIVTGESYFCSELVADAWKCLGILPPNTNSAQYLPSHFASKKKIELCNGSIENELLIDFEIDPDYMNAYEEQTKRLEKVHHVRNAEKKN
eukprot:GDKJ01024953.1.p1 GENE.GDKJ01024953.1~~GDKJ01024953.1.p1  ORF type:complete len:438 (+),score=104.42 GDKJ01024953.1:27-1340(+)